MRLMTDVLWKLQCRLNRRLPGSPDVRTDRPSEFYARGPALQAQPAPELMTVITTHARVDACLTLLGQLHESLTEAGLEQRAFVLVLEDPSPQHDYAPVIALLEEKFPGRFAFEATGVKLGKPLRCIGYQHAFDFAHKLAPRYTLFLEDDAVLDRPFIREAIARWQEIQDANKAVLYLCAFDDDEVEGRWVKFRRQVLPSGRVQLTQWFDLHAFLVDKHFFELLDYTLFRPWLSRWKNWASRSSGVSEQFTLRLFGRGNIYQVTETLALHGGIPSVLNAEARSARALNNHPRTKVEPAE